MSTPRLSVSTWSLHRQLGKPGFTGPAHGMQIPIETHNKGSISLLELPARIAEFGIRTLWRFAISICLLLRRLILRNSAQHSQLPTLNSSPC